MKKKLIVFTDQQAKELETYPNQSEIIRTALDVYISNISPEMLNAMRMTFKQINTRLAAIEQAVDVIASAANTSITRTDDWGV